MQFEERSGVKVDISIPESDRNTLYDQWKEWEEGKAVDFFLDDSGSSDEDLWAKCLRELNGRSTLNATRYEHFLIASGVGLPPDPFKPLSFYARGRDLSTLIEKRRMSHQPSIEYRHFFPSHLVEGFEEVTGLDKIEHGLIMIMPDITTEGRVPIPRVVGVYNTETENRIALDKGVVDRIQLPRSKIITLKSGVKVVERFNFEEGYSIESS